MATRSVETESQRDMLLTYIKSQKLPFTCEVVKGRRRSTEQNRLQFLWVNEIAAQLGDQTPEEVRAYCKLHLGVPILRAENELFRQAYDEVVRPLPYEAKLKLMAAPFDFAVTRLMNSAQETKYLDAIQAFAAERGIQLTQPEAA